MAAGGVGDPAPWALPLPAVQAQARPASHLGLALPQVQSLCTQVDGGPARTAFQRVRPCSLDAPTQRLITNIFSKNMFSDAMALMNLGEDPGPGRGGGAGGRVPGVAAG